MAIILRQTKGSALTYRELDGNFTYLSGSYLPNSGSNSYIGSLLVLGTLTVSGSNTFIANTEMLQGRNIGTTASPSYTNVASGNYSNV